MTSTLNALEFPKSQLNFQIISDQGVFAKSFLLTSTLGGLYIEPIDGSNGAQKISDQSDSNSMSPTSYNPCISSTSPSTSFLCKPPDNKLTSTTETQTMPASGNAPVPAQKAASVYHYSPRVKIATTEEDEEAHRFVQEFKARRISLKLTQSDIGEELNLRAGARYGQSYISRMESIQLSTAIVLRMKPLLEKLLDEKEEERRRLKQNMDFDEEEYQVDRKRKKRTNFTPEQSILLTKYFADQSRPSPQEIDDIARKIDVDRNSVKMWFNNKRQSEKFRANPLPGIGSINSVGSLNPYATTPYGNMSSSFLMSGLMSNMQMNPVTTSSLNNLKLDYNLSNKLPHTTLSLENVNLATTQAPFVFNNKDLNHLYNAETAARLSSAVCSNLKKESPSNKAVTEPTMVGNHTNPPFTLASQGCNPFIFNKELSSLYQNNRNDEAASQHKVTNDLAQIYKERAVSDANGGTLSGSPPRNNGNIHSIATIKAISPPYNNPAFSISQSLINHTLTQAAMSQQDGNVGGGNISISPKFNRSP